MELTIISSEIIKPSKKPTHFPRKKLSLFDQLTPTTYPSLVLFYSAYDPNLDVEKTLTNLKKALSETLTIFYPLSGRTKENQYIDEFDTGVPFVAARANLPVSDFLDEMNKDMALLNKLVPIQPFRKETKSSYPLIGFQVTVFSRGGIALGNSLCHKTSDGSTGSHFLKTWAAIFTGSPHAEPLPNHTRAAELFPPLKEVPENTAALLDQMWFMKSNYVTRRFYFTRESVEAIQALAKSETVPSPSRNEAVGCFIWKHAMVASWRASGSSDQKPCVAVHAVNLRPRIKARARELSECTGNLFWWAGVASNTGSEDEIDLSSLVSLTRELMADYNEEYIEGMVGEDGFEPIFEYLDQLDAMLSGEDEKPEVIGFTNWKNFFNGIDFGWGKPVWVGAHGKVGEEFRNMVVLIDKPGNGKEIEAFVTLEEKLMAALERDDKFLALSVSQLIPTSDGECDNHLHYSRL